MNAIELNAVTFEQGGLQLNDITFQVPEGYVTGFIGTNGAGKTTIIRLIMDLYSPQSGTITLWQQRMQEDPVGIKDRIGFVYSESYFNENWTVKKLEKIIAPFYSRWDHDKFLQLLQRFNIVPEKKIKTLSTGMKMKLSLTIALSHHADLFIFDEPTSGLDPVVRNEVLEMIQQELIKSNKTVFMSTHIISDLEMIADYIVYLSDGQIKLHGSTNDILQRYQIIHGSILDLDDELSSLLLYKDERATGFTALTEHAQVFEEILGNKVEIERPTIEKLMVYLENGKDNCHKQSGGFKQ
ncbi:ABC transporter ATP-binding protein [Staphylococcus simiae]|uniref:phenol-soluble modulin export ABC transporter ATP-binding protein PmtA n=1 Tax=Staphylococcus simiae TaxID=308354 RepID=UPI001A960312|nr:ABC transporter ATP-binding protein [Staphylococcus simiae]MBO1198339.1 ABC transporter ATP-binding protein [Staphylococcus simiae]MBO1200369.1 ABC transporter ATP-binding protein [Staphylococcus simiae]MBO1202642.1 ABC transporter ATP-binding protein [Staphylococcus simiae]MBO1210331.1 ABC transporter ATP-binding protein [Staphylococcus simiae]MBO1228784.1 ABC transporter ATP-binding protein [Staphylococcus simiae]